MVKPTTIENLRGALTVHAVRPGASPAELRTHADANSAGLPVPEGLTVESACIGGRPAERLAPTHIGTSARTVLYLHGGGFCMGSLLSVRALAANIAIAARAAVVVPDYRLAPEHPCPAAIDDALAVYDALLAEGVDPARTVIAGDSAGGGLAVATLIAVRDTGRPLPAAGIGLSPWLNLDPVGDSLDGNADLDPMLSRELLDVMAGWYAGGLPRTDPQVSPVNADLAGLPPLLLHVGDAECLRDDILRFAEVARLAGVQVDCEVWPDMLHVWHLFAPRLPEANHALTALGDWLHHRWPAAPAPSQAKDCG